MFLMRRIDPIVIQQVLHSSADTYVTEGKCRGSMDVGATQSNSVSDSA